jgi:hypothetical protein
VSVPLKGTGAKARAGGWGPSAAAAGNLCAEEWQLFLDMGADIVHDSNSCPTCGLICWWVLNFTCGTELGCENSEEEILRAHFIQVVRGYEIQRKHTLIYRSLSHKFFQTTSAVRSVHAPEWEGHTHPAGKNIRYVCWCGLETIPCQIFQQLLLIHKVHEIARLQLKGRNFLR